MSVTIYSKSHPNRMMTYKVLRNRKKMFDLYTMPDLAETAAKLKAIGIDPGFVIEIKCCPFISLDDIMREVDELREDYNAMFPEDSE